jgi:hypothetical protein
LFYQGHRLATLLTIAESTLGSNGVRTGSCFLGYCGQRHLPFVGPIHPLEEVYTKATFINAANKRTGQLGNKLKTRSNMDRSSTLSSTDEELSEESDDQAQQQLSKVGVGNKKKPPSLHNQQRQERVGPAQHQ